MTIIPYSRRFDQFTLSQMVELDAVAQRYRQFFALFDWSLVAEPPQDPARPGKRPHPESAYVKALLLKINEGFAYCTQWRRFLVEHPFLVLELGFRPVLDVSQPYGFDVEKTVPTARWLSEKQRTLEQPALQALLAATVQDLRQEIPGLGEVVAFDVTHIYAWVKENNLRVYVKDRYKKEVQPRGDHDCRLGVKKSSTKGKAAEAREEPRAASATAQDKKPPKAKQSSTTKAAKGAKPEGKKEEGKKEAHKKEEKETFWGYGSGVASATVAGYGDVVLAEYTQPFNENDITDFISLYIRTVGALGFLPTHLAADAAFDAWYVYQMVAHRGGIAAVPLNAHGPRASERDEDGVPFCAKGLLMQPTYQFAHTYGYRTHRFRCPLLFPQPSGQTCDHQQFEKGKGCVKDLNWEAGGQMRVTLNRDGPLFHAVYDQRTSTERINSQSKELGLKRPHVRNIRAVRNLNTLTYLVINARALQRARDLNASLLTDAVNKVA
jgi:hypothetical protein